jgi:hypothetical protein
MAFEMWEASPTPITLEMDNAIGLKEAPHSMFSTEH